MSPAVRLLLEIYHLNPRLIQATGPKGRLLKGDVLRYMAQGGQPFTKPDKEATPTYLWGKDLKRLSIRNYIN